MNQCMANNRKISDENIEDVHEIYKLLEKLDGKVREALKDPELYLDTMERTIAYFSMLKLDYLRTDDTAKNRWDWGGLGFADPYYGFAEKEDYTELTDGEKIKWVVVTDHLWRTIYTAICYLDPAYANDIIEDVNDTYNNDQYDPQDLRKYFLTNLHRTETGRYGISEWLRSYMLRP